MVRIALFWGFLLAFVSCAPFGSGREEDFPPEKIGAQEDLDRSVVFESGDSASHDADAAQPPYIFVPAMKSPSFVDTFDRPNGPDVGNGWIERVDAFSIVDGSAESMLSGGVDQIVRRSNMFQDLEISGLVTYGSSRDEVGLYARVQSEEEPQKFHGYRVWFAATLLEVEYRSLSSRGQKAQRNIYPSLVTGRRYRLHLRISGTDFVTIEAGLFTEVGEHVVSAYTVDKSADRIVQEGWFGFGSRESRTRWDEIVFYVFP